MATWDGELQEIEALLGVLRDTMDDLRRKVQWMEVKITTLSHQQNLVLKETAKRRQI